MMDFELQLQKPTRKDAYISALLIGVAYIAGGILPMIPYFIVKRANIALFISIAVTAVILLAFGFYKSRFLGASYSQSFLSAFKTLLIGAVAAGASYGIVRAIDAAPTI